MDNFLPWHNFVLTRLESETDLRIVSIASDGLEAIQKAKELQPDMILMDVSLPGMNGFEATRQIRTLSPASKVLFLSEYRSSDLIQAAFEAGGRGYVLKSDSNSDLIPGIRAVLLDQQFVSRSLTHWRDSFSPAD
ncbi:MAG TPA: response regulator transcription factor [Candidatus Acidoferrum sp.]